MKIQPSLYPISPRLAKLAGNILIATLPGGPYLLPATLQPMLMLVLSGSVRPLFHGTQVAEIQTLPRIALYGAFPHIRGAEALPGTQVAIVSILPGQLTRLFGLNEADIVGKVVPLAELLPGHFIASHFGELEALEASRTPGEPGVSAWAWIACLERFLLALQTAHEHYRSGLVVPENWLFQPVTEIAARFNLGERQFERRFTDSYGQSLRSFRRQFRCSRMVVDQVLRHGEIKSWADISTVSGYSDQAHLTRDLKHFTGYTPASLIRNIIKDNPALWPYQLNAAEIPDVFGAAAF